MHNIKRWLFLSLFVFLSACGGGGGGDDDDITPPSTNTAPSLSLSVNALTLNEDFGTFIINTTATDAEDGPLPIAVTGQNASLFAITTFTNQIMLTSVANANGIATLTVSANDSENLSVTTEVVVVVNAINDTPTLALSTTAISLNEDFGTFIINAIATDVEDGALLVTVSGQAGLVTTDITTDQITLTSIANANGIATLIVSANDSENLSVTTEVVVTINAINDTPTLTFSTTQLSLNANFISRTIATATDVDDASLLLTFAPSATNVVQIMTVANQFILNPITNAFGDTTITLAVSDDDGARSSSQIFTVRVNAPIASTTPTLALSTQNITLDEDFGTFIINTTATDAEDGTLSVTVSGQAGLLTTNATTDQITLTSVANANGIVTLNVRAVDSGALAISTEVVVVINAINDTPTLTLATTDITIVENATARQTISITNVVDVDGNTLTFSVIASTSVFSSNPTPIASFSDTRMITFSRQSTTAQLYYTLLPDTTGTGFIQIALTDGIETQRTTVSVTVTEVKNPPQITQDFRIHRFFDARATRVGVVGSVLFAARGVLTESTATTSTDGTGDFSNQLNFARSLGGSLAELYTEETYNALLGSVLVSNGTATLGFADDRFWLGLTDTPNAFGASVADQSASEDRYFWLSGQRVSQGLSSARIDAPGVYIGWGSSAPAAIEHSCADLILGTEVEAGFRPWASDGCDGSVFVIFDVLKALMQFPNGLPTTSSMVFQANSPITRIRLSGYDLDGSDNALSWQVTNASGGSIATSTVYSGTGAQTLEIAYTAVSNFSGTATLFVSLNDGDSATQNSTARVLVVNNTPTLILSTNTISLDEDFISFVINTTATDAAGITDFSVSTGNGIVLVTTSADAITLQSLPNINGAVTLTVVVDSGFLANTQTISVVVNPVNDRPVLMLSLNSLSLNEDFGTFIINTTATDAEDGMLSVSVSGQAGLVTTTITTGQITLTSIANAKGRTTLTVSASDSENLLVTDEVVVIINAVNDNPVLTLSTTNLSLNEDFGTFIINITATDIEDGGLPVTVTGQDASIFTVTTSTNQIMLTSVANANGIVTLTVSANDSENLSASTEVVVVVNAVNDTPTLTFSTTQLSLNANFISQTIATAADVDDASLLLTFALSATDVVQITTVANQFILNPITNAFGNTTITLAVSDDDGARSSSQIFTVRVNAPTASTTPTLALSTQSITLDEDFGTFIINTTATDAEDGTLSVTVSGQAGLLTTNATTGQITLTSIANANGTTTLTVRATDSGNLSVTTEVVVTINAINDTPTLTLSTTNITIVENATARQTISITDVADIEGSTLTFSVIASTSVFSSNPTSVVSFSDTRMITFSRQSTTAQLYYTLRPDSTGTGFIQIALTDGIDTQVTTVTVTVTEVKNPPQITQDFRIHRFFDARATRVGAVGGVLFAARGVFTGSLASTSTDGTGNFSNQLNFARSLGGSLAELYTEETYNALLGSVLVANGAATTGFNDDRFWLGLTSVPSFFGVTLPNQSASEERYFWLSGQRVSQGLRSARIDAPGVYIGWGSSAPFASDQPCADLILGTEVEAGFRPWASDGCFGGFFDALKALMQFPNGLPTTSSMIVQARSPITFIRLSGYDLDGSDNALSWQVTDASGGGINTSTVYSSTGAQTLEITYTPVSGFSGTATLVVNLDDGDSATQNSTARVLVVNNTPTLTLSTNAVSLDEDFTSFVVNTIATDAEGITDFSVSTGNGIVLVNTSVDAITLQSLPNINGAVTLTVVADSGLLANTQTISVVVNPVNDTPTLSLSVTQRALVQNFGTFVINTTATDVDLDPLDFSVSTGNGVVNVTTSVNTITLQSFPNVIGDVTLTVSVSDGLLTTTQSIFITVSRAFTFEVSTNTIVVDEDFNTFTINTTATAADGAILPISVLQSTPLLTVNISTGRISLSSIANANGVTTLTVSAANQSGLTNTTEVAITINSINDTPTLSLSSTNLTLASNSTGLITAFVTDVETSSASLIFSVQQNPSLLQVSTPGNVIVLRSNATAGSTTLVITVTDGDGSSASATAQVTVLSGVLNIALNVKRIDFSWNTLPTANHYRMLSNVDLNAGGGFVDASSAGLVFIPNSTNIINTTVSATVDVARYLSAANGPQYLLEGCSSVDNSVCSIHAQEALSNIQLRGLIGYFKASFAVEGVFGRAVAISGDGNTLVVGAPGENSDATGINGDQTNNNASASGAAYVFVRNSAGTWSQQAYVKASNTGALDQFGTAVAINDDGNTIVVGALGEDSTATGINGDQLDNSASDSGAAYVFVRSSTGTWSQQAYIKASNAEALDDFGRTVSVTADGNTLAIGAPLEDSTATGINGDQTNNGASGSGAAYVFVRSTTGTWSQQAYIKASNAEALDEFGFAVSVGDDGNTLIVGASFEDSNATGINGNQTTNSASASGAVYVFMRSSTGTWSQEAYIKASNTGVNDQFGLAASISGDGNTLLISSIGEDSTATGINGNQANNGANGAGAAYVFVRSSTGTWSQQAYIKASNTGNEDEFGSALSINNDGSIFAIGAPFEDSDVSGINGDQINDNVFRSGAAYLFVRSSTGTWSQRSYIKASNTGNLDRFGSALSISGDGKTLSIGAPFEDSDATGINGDQMNNNQSEAGAVYLY